MCINLTLAPLGTIRKCCCQVLSVLPVSTSWTPKMYIIRVESCLADVNICANPSLGMHVDKTWGRFKNTYELLKLRALKVLPVNKIYIFQCMGKIFCVEFQRYPFKFLTKNLTHILKDMIFIQHWNFKSQRFSIGHYILVMNLIFISFGQSASQVVKPRKFLERETILFLEDGTILIISQQWRRCSLMHICNAVIFIYWEGNVVFYDICHRLRQN